MKCARFKNALPRKNAPRDASNIVQYHDVLVNIQPLRDELAASEAKLAAANAKARPFKRTQRLAAAGR